MMIDDGMMLMALDDNRVHARVRKEQGMVWHCSESCIQMMWVMRA